MGKNLLTETAVSVPFFMEFERPVYEMHDTEPLATM